MEVFCPEAEWFVGDRVPVRPIWNNFSRWSLCMSRTALKQILKPQSPSLWMGFYMVFSWMLCAWRMVGVQGVGCSFVKSSFLAFHQARVPKGSSPGVPWQVWPCLAGGDPAAACPGNRSSCPMELLMLHLSSALNRRAISVAVSN